MVLPGERYGPHFMPLLNASLSLSLSPPPSSSEEEGLRIHLPLVRNAVYAYGEFAMRVRHLLFAYGDFAMRANLLLSSYGEHVLCVCKLTPNPQSNTTPRVLLQLFAPKRCFLVLDMVVFLSPVASVNLCVCTPHFSFFALSIFLFFSRLLCWRCDRESGGCVRRGAQGCGRPYSR